MIELFEAIKKYTDAHFEYNYYSKEDFYGSVNREKEILQLAEKHLKQELNRLINVNK